MPKMCCRSATRTLKAHTIGLQCVLAATYSPDLTIFQRKKILIVLMGIVAVVNSTFGSSLPSGTIQFTGPYFNVTNQAQLVLPVSLFLVGYVLGPLFFGPLSESFGRRIIMISSFIFFTLFTLACALAPNWPAFLFFRLMCGINASSAIAVVGGLFADVYGDPVSQNYSGGGIRSG